MSNGFVPSDLQAKAIREIKDWFQHRTSEQRVFRVFGYAGSGKTTLTRHAIDELGLDTMTRDADGIVSGAGGVLYAAYTGKAALVMTRTGGNGSGVREKIICLKNRNDLGLVNGMFLELSDVRDENEVGFSATLRTEDGEPVGPTDSEAARYVIYKGHFDDHVVRDPNRERRDHWVKKGLIEAVWGYAITCHKAQGSQYPTVVVYDDGLGRTAEDRARSGSTPRSPAPSGGS